VGSESVATRAFAVNPECPCFGFQFDAAKTVNAASPWQFWLGMEHAFRSPGRLALERWQPNSDNRSMCARFTLRRPLSLVVKELADTLSVGLFDFDPPPRYNIAPTQLLAAVRATADAGRSELVPLKWGLIPSWSKDPKIGSSLLNARAETVAEKPAFRAAFKRRRCLILADGYYEWTGKPGKKQPWHFHLPGDRPFAVLV
jgi:hypothetical protein